MYVKYLKTRPVQEIKFQSGLYLSFPKNKVLHMCVFSWFWWNYQFSLFILLLMATSENYEIRHLFLLTKITFRNEHPRSFEIFIMNDLSQTWFSLTILRTVAQKKQTKTSKKKWKYLCILPLFKFSVFVCQNFIIFE